MKKQNVNNKLAFNKAVVIELNEAQMYDVDGGTSPVCAAAVASSNWCIAGAGALIGASIAYFVD
ncbi:MULTISPECIES: class IIb bacteriocin, lactobin A/cerein 7B family [unclassified Flavobacterium]|uniref:class IIb bacteriocin, lactobin A/cerein 7B family n=1 Tax=unclassified Flavobacterium TaxID=196869 RepID=UPI0036208714